MKRCLNFLILLALVLGMMPRAAAAGSGSTVYVRKHVSMLYDNSGSMSLSSFGKDGYNVRWAHASYAAQAFSGLLNASDTLTITFMNPVSGGNQIEVDLAGSRQTAVSDVLQMTNEADGNTPIETVETALNVLVAEGLQPPDQAEGQTAGEQYWLVLTTDGSFENVTEAYVISTLESLLKEYSNLNIVYLGIGSQGVPESKKARDFRNEPTLTAYPNFHPEYAETEEQITEIMQRLANQVAGRYDVSDSAAVNGNTVTIQPSGETSPIRNVAILAQETDARLVSAVAEDGTELVVSRDASIQYPYNPSYSNVYKEGGYSALITGPGEEKIPSGAITLTFSAPVNGESLSLMYEPAIHIRSEIERKDDGGNWVPVVMGRGVYDGDELRVSYTVCEDGTDTPVDTGRLFGKTEERMTYNGQEIRNGESFSVSEGDGLLSIDLSMLDGTYRLNASENIKVGRFSADRLQVTSSGPLTISRSLLADNRDQYIDFTVTTDGLPLEDAMLSRLTLQPQRADGKTLEGEVQLPGDGTVRFIPRDAECPSGTCSVTLLLEGTALLEETVTVEPDIFYIAQASEGITVMDNGADQIPEGVRFTVIRSEDGRETPITEAEAALFAIRAATEDGQTLDWETRFESGGCLALIPRGDTAPVGNYIVLLTELSTGEALAETEICVLKHDAVYRIDITPPTNPEIRLFHLRRGMDPTTFLVSADGETLGESQLRLMLENGTVYLTREPDTRHIRIHTEIVPVSGGYGLVCTPESRAGNWFTGYLQNVAIAWGGPRAGTYSLTLVVDQPAGAVAVAEYQMTETLPERILYMLSSILLLLLIGLVTDLAVCNIISKRFRAGSFVHAQLRRDEDDMKVAYCSTDPVKFRLRFLLRPEPQRQVVSGVEFEADTNGWPKAIISGTRKNIDAEYRTNATHAHHILATMFNNQRIPDTHIPLSRVLPSTAMIGTDADQIVSWTPTLRSEEYVMKFSLDANEEVESMELWGFVTQANH